MRDTEVRETSATVTKSPALVRGFSRLVPIEALESALYLSPLSMLAFQRGAPQGYEVLLRVAKQDIRCCLTDRTALLAWAAAEGSDVLAVVQKRLALLDAPCQPFAGLEMNGRPHVMGIINATPDSFSDGGKHLKPDDAVAAGLRMIDAGATLIDVGGESTRPGSDEVDPDEEIRRVVPVVRGLAERGVLVSIDTRHAKVMGAAVEAGAGILNDVTALEGDPDSLSVAARLQVPTILMHIQGDPRSMQTAPCYAYAPLDVYDGLARRIDACVAAGLSRDLLALDVGIGFGKTVDHNTQILARLAMYHGLGCAQLLGVSRKTYIARLSRGEPPLERVPGSLATAVMAAGQGVQMIRVHDVPETVQALAVWAAVSRSAVCESL